MVVGAPPRGGRSPRETGSPPFIQKWGPAVKNAKEGKKEKVVRQIFFLKQICFLK